MPDVRPISADWLKMTFEEDVHVDFVHDIGGAKIAMIPYRTVMEVIDAAPTIGAQPVKRGYWIIDEEEPMYGGHRKIWVLRCSECRKDPIKHIGGGLSNWWFETPPFCPVCGADMRDDNTVEKIER